MIFWRQSMPMVAIEPGEKVLSANLFKMQLFPTPLSPKSKSLIFFSFILRKRLACLNSDSCQLLISLRLHLKRTRLVDLRRIKDFVLLSRTAARHYQVLKSIMSVFTKELDQRVLLHRLLLGPLGDGTRHILCSALLTHPNVYLRLSFDWYLLFETSLLKYRFASS